MDVQTEKLFPGHEVEHVLDRGWGTLANGKLLAAAAAAGFDVMVTVDKDGELTLAGERVQGHDLPTIRRKSEERGPERD